MITKRSNNLCDVYILPLVNLNTTSFGIGNFANSFVDTTDQYVVVKMKQINAIIKANPYYRFDFPKDDHQFVAFEIPETYKPTVKLFREGKYSLFPLEVKNIIKKKSGLMHRVPKANGKTITARELLVLDKDKILREVLEKELGLNEVGNTPISPDAELGSIPGEENFLELNLSAQLVC
jgi:hypothetical protein